MIARRFTPLRATLAMLFFAFAPAAGTAQGGMLGGMGGEGLNTRPFLIAIDGGLTLARGEVKSRNENGFHFGASVIYKIPGLRVAVRPEFTYTTLRFKSSVIPPRTGTEKNYTRLLTGLAHVELPFSNGLYAFGGVGGMNIINILAKDTTAQSSTSLAMDVGGGYRFEFGPIQSFFEMRYATAASNAQKFTYPRATVVPLSFGFLF